MENLQKVVVDWIKDFNEAMMLGYTELEYMPEKFNEKRE